MKLYVIIKNIIIILKNIIPICIKTFLHLCDQSYQLQNTDIMKKVVL